MSAYERIFESIPDAYVVTDLNGQVLLVNPAFTRLFGFEAREIIGRQPQTLFASSELYAALWNSIARNGQSEATLLQFQRKDGTLFYGEATGAVIDEDGLRVIRILPAPRPAKSVELRKNRTPAQIIRLQNYRAALKQNDALPILLGQLLEVIGGEAAAVAIRAGGSKSLRLAQAAGLWSSLEPRSIAPAASVWDAIFKGGKNYFAAGPEEITEASGLPTRDLCNAVAVPIRSPTGILGALWFAGNQPLNPDEIQFLVAAAGLIANQLDQATDLKEQMMGQLAAFQSLGKAITESLDLNVTLGVFVNEIVNSLQVDAADILIYQPTTRELRLVAGRGFQNFNKARHTLRFGRGLAGPALLERRLVSWDLLSPDFDQIERKELFQEERFVWYAALPMVARGETKGIVEVFHRSSLSLTPGMTMLLEAVTAQAAIAVDKSELYEGYHRAQSAMELLLDSTLLGWMRALDMRDQYGGRHIQWMIEMTQRLARDLGMPGEQIANVRRGVILHDIGKMGVPDRILHKPGPLSAEEWQVMRKHPVFAYQMLSPIPFLRPALEIPYCHHERWNGSGYPRGIRGSAIPLAARIFAVVDVWDAMTSSRPHRNAAPDLKARQFIEANSGELFDPAVVKAFADRLDENGNRRRPTVQD